MQKVLRGKHVHFGTAFQRKRMFVCRVHFSRTQYKTNWGGKQDLVPEAAGGGWSAEALLLEICEAQQQVQINCKFPVIL